MLGTTMSFSVKLCASQSTHLLQAPHCSKKTKSSILALQSPAAPKSGGDLGSKFAKSSVVNRTGKQYEVKSLVDLIHGCAEKGSLSQAEALHGLVLKSNFQDRELLLLLNHVANMYSKCSDFGSARQVFAKLSQRNIFSWTVMIVGSTNDGSFLDGFRYFCEMQNDGIIPDKFVYSAVIQSCIGLDCIELGKMVHGQIVIRGLACDSYVSTSLLSMYAKMGRIKDSCQVFSTIEEHNQVSWNAMISGLTSNGLHKEAYDQFIKMWGREIMPNISTFISVLKAVGELGDLGKGKEVHGYISEMGLESNVHVGTSLIDMYSNCGSLCDARSVFNLNFIHCELNTPWNAMISGYSQNGFAQETLEIFVKMCQNHIKADLYTYCSVFSSIAAMKCLQFGKEVHGMVLKSGSDMLVSSVYNSIADAYAKSGSLEDMKKVFDCMEERDVVSWTTLVTAFSQCSEWEEALAIFSQMREEGFTPNQFTFSSVLDACASLCFHEYGQQVHGLLSKLGLSSENCIESALIGVYAKCGNIDEAKKVFEKISRPDIVTWTAVISAYAHHGHVDDALEHFRRVDQLGLKVNNVTLLCVLFACSHGGMVEEGLHYFQQMRERYGLDPQMEHYACIVDLLGRVGHLDDAMQFIEKMPMEPNEVVWLTLLGACRVHGNVDLATIAAKKIISIKPDDSAAYVLLSGTCIETGNVEDGLNYRDLMKEQGVIKESGISWISVNGRVHKFCAGDQRHPEKDDIYSKLAGLRETMKSLGYLPDLSYGL